MEGSNTDTSTTAQGQTDTNWNPKRIGLGIGIVLIIVSIIYSVVTGNWIPSIVMGLILILSIGGYFIIQRELSHRERAKAVADELGRPDDWKAVKAALALSSIDDPHENEDHIEFLTDLVENTNKSSVSQALSLSNSSDTTIERDRLVYLSEIIYHGRYQDLVGRVTMLSPNKDAMAAREYLEEHKGVDPEVMKNMSKQAINKKHSTPDSGGRSDEIDPAHIYQAKQGNWGRAAVAGALEHLIDTKDSDQFKVEVRESDIPFADDSVKFSIDDIKGISNGSGDLIEEGDVVKLDIDIKLNNNKLAITGVNEVELLHENEDPILDKVMEIEESLDESLEAIIQLIDLREKGSISATEFESQYESVLEDGIKGGVPPVDAVDYVDRLDVYREYDTISDTDYEFYKSLLLNRESILMTKLESIESPSFTETDLHQAREIIA